MSVKATDFSFDLETLGVRPYSAIIEIGCAAFNRDTAQIVGHFTTVVSLASNLECGMSVDASTVAWWMRQPDKVRLPLFNEDAGVSLREALQMLSQFILKQGGSNACVWGFGPGFDINLLEDAYRQCAMEVPWRFFLARCGRTVIDLANIDAWSYRKAGVHHRALDDAVNQARMILDGIAVLRKGGDDEDDEL